MLEVVGVAEGRILYFVAPSGFRDEELFDTRAALEEEGFESVTASTRPGVARGKLGGDTRIDLTLDEIDAGDFRAVVFVGGPGVEEHALYENRKVVELAQRFATEGRIVSAICIAPRILAKAGLLKGRRATAFADSETLAMLKAGGALYSGKPVEADGRIVTANGPMAARDFGNKIAEILRKA